MRDLIQALPKTETHLHLEGALPYELLTSWDPEQWPPAKLGRLRLKEKEIADAAKKLIRIVMTSERYPGVDFCYERTLPENAKCKIVEETRTYSTLACSME